MLNFIIFKKRWTTPYYFFFLIKFKRNFQTGLIFKSGSPRRYYWGYSPYHSDLCLNIHVYTMPALRCKWCSNSLANKLTPLCQTEHILLVRCTYFSFPAPICLHQPPRPPPPPSYPLYTWCIRCIECLLCKFEKAAIIWEWEIRNTNLFSSTLDPAPSLGRCWHPQQFADND